MNLRTALQGFIRAVVEEAERNPDFARKLENFLGLGVTPATAPPQKRAAGRKRRMPAVLDPIGAAREGEEALRRRLAALNLEQLKDIVADYGMDPGKLVMKWKMPERIIDRIVELSLARSVKGDVFLK